MADSEKNQIIRQQALSLANTQATKTHSVAPMPFIVIAGRKLRPTPVFDTYWRFASERQKVYEARLSRQAPPWTGDAILQKHRFTNCYRAADRVSQFLISQVSYLGNQDWSEIFFRTLIFKFFNRVSTWRLLEKKVGEISWKDYDFTIYNRILTDAFESGQKLYSPAYVVPPPQLGDARKHTNHLRLLEMMMHTGAPEKVADSDSMREAFEALRSYPAIGDFLAYQYLIDLNYSSALNFSEMEFVVPGPGARDGIRKCFGPAANGIEQEIIHYMAESQKDQFARLGLNFGGLRGRPLQLIDCQNLFCEVDKYARVAHPEISGISGRTRIKQVYKRDAEALTAWFPPKWGINAGEMPQPAGGAVTSSQSRAAESFGFTSLPIFPI
ncbi:nucleotide kinase domain-containing protein [Streptosporangium sp. H16]|uniref:nucleotide kinase domain-containing protein n=1 Tax=Streptosporangium sp. H16 TaxID=3444184 RepID=UPI003F7AF7CD